MRETQSPPDDDFPQLPDDLNNFATRLAEFKPQTASVDRDQLLFQAGMAAARQERLRVPAASVKALQFWKAAALVLTAVSAGLTTTIAVRPAPQPQVVVIERDLTKTAVVPSVSVAANEEYPSSLEPDSDVSQETPHQPSVHEFAVDSRESHQKLIEGLRTRQDLIAQIAQTGIAPEVARAATDDAGPSLFARPAQPPLTTRSLMLSVRSKDWINHLIEEPQL